MARVADEWMTEPPKVSYDARYVGLVALGDWAVPERLTMTLPGSKDFPEGKRWPSIHLNFEVREGAAVCVEFRVVSEPGDRPVRAADIRLIDIDALATRAFSMAGFKRSDRGVGWQSDLEPDAARIRSARGLVNNGYREPLAELREVARVYLDPAVRGKPTDSVMDVLGYGSRATASRKVRAARDAGLIPAPGATDVELREAFRKLAEA